MVALADFLSFPITSHKSSPISYELPRNEETAMNTPQESKRPRQQKAPSVRTRNAELARSSYLILSTNIHTYFPPWTIVLLTRV